ncbi:aromatic ring-hydroxylating dioxygenase subunit alpha [Paraburkholderia fungorum]|jgi:anthranilate 1,2-dioxygenase large subunit|uniref:aromatic ring-hydroxylating dioxygenase subunit alpha n=1 Tax=Paraburkholderia fungorum TaxID=134537 RepID=UPI000DB43B01|nr:aromatic ring-hydroxylating dioxygenase subunit alpha [Paraburkholderia fungorum]MBU7436236.1 aromatic ring-hydroxylating dioxygenase subunit alpha [Paraburkholderia fungorum]PZR45634.1 MAG: Rieske (2Fe-2S) protein [Paraburkholderia fungorum]
MTIINVAKASPDLNWPRRDEGYTVPYRVFTDKAYYDLEQEWIFRGDVWSFVALEAEIPNSGDIKATYIGETPVIVTRDEEGGVNVMLNRCAHRGALVCRELRSNVRTLDCVYHQWSYDLKGQLRGVPFRRGVRGEGGMPECFDMMEHGLDRLRVGIINGLVFATFSARTEPLQDYLGADTVAVIERIFHKPVEILGDQRQYVHGNWKLYAENTRDPYHASLLHLFHNTFGLYRSTQTGVSLMDATRRHSVLKTTSSGSSKEEDEKAYKDVRTYNTNFKLQDPSVLAGKKEFADGVNLIINSIFPNLVVQQIANTLAVRQTVTYAPNAFELVWTQFGYAEDSDEMRKIRLKQANLIGPAGFISMEDGEAVEIVQEAVVRDSEKTSYIAMGGGKSTDANHLVSEGTIIGFWENYERMLGVRRMT